MNAVAGGHAKAAVWVGAAILVVAGCGSGGSAKSAAPSTTAHRAASTSTESPTRITDAATSSTSVKKRTATTTTTPVTNPSVRSTTPPTPSTTPPTAVALVSSEVSAAVATVTERGYTPLDTDDYAQGAPGDVHVIIATKTRSPGSHAQQAFFFAGGRFLQTDLATTSAAIQVAWRTAATVALSYGIYRPSDGICCPGGGSMIVRYKWTGAQLLVLDPVPPAAARR